MSQVFEKFLENSLAEASALEKQSDVLELVPLPPLPPSTYLCKFAVPYLRRQADGTIALAEGPVIAAVHFPEDYLRSVDHWLYLKVATLLTPDFIHPNVRGGTVCLGADFAPGTPIKGLLWELYDIVTYQNFSLVEHNALNAEACRLLRARQELVKSLRPVPFLRRKRRFKIIVRD
jgi:hypothetical protein